LSSSKSNLFTKKLANKKEKAPPHLPVLDFILLTQARTHFRVRLASCKDSANQENFKIKSSETMILF